MWKIVAGILIWLFTTFGGGGTSQQSTSAMSHHDAGGPQIGDTCDPNDPSTYEPYECVENEYGVYVIAN